MFMQEVQVRTRANTEIRVRVRLQTAREKTIERIYAIRSQNNRADSTHCRAQCRCHIAYHATI